MKKLIIFSIILVSIVISESTFAQKYRKKEVSLISLKLNINSDYRIKVDAIAVTSTNLKIR
ncbi:MAG TPA: hypothetical protein PK758_11115, partial [Tenuifilaceae bacterium]|nr:hypothetical protein [Tenuifilaceae bacterium]